MPARAREQAEAVARGCRRADAPARRRRARFQRLRRPQQQERQAGIRRGEMQPLAQFQIELVDDAGDGGGAPERNASSMRPQGVLAVRRLDQDQPGRIETERVQAMPVRPAVLAARRPGGREDLTAAPPPMGEGRAEGRRARRSAGRPSSDPLRISRPPFGGEAKRGQQRHDEAEGRGGGACRLGHDLMQGAAGEAALRADGDRGRQGRRGRVSRGCETPPFSGNRRRNSAATAARLLRITERAAGWVIGRPLCPEGRQLLEQNKNNAKGSLLRRLRPADPNGAALAGLGIADDA